MGIPFQDSEMSGGPDEAHEPGADVGQAWNVPFRRNPFFTGRERILNELHQNLNSSDRAKRVVALHGLAGVGKTQIALEYCYRHRDAYPIIWWIPSEESTTLALGYAKMARQFGIRVMEGTNLDYARNRLRRVLGERDDWLIVFDNANSAQQVRNYLPLEAGGRIIVTSRNQNWQGVAESFPVRGMERREAMEFLKKRSRRDDPNAEQLANALADLPLALEQAAALIEQTRISFSDYLRRFETHWAELLARGRPSTEYPETVAMAWELSFRQVDETNPSAAAMLNLCSFLAPHPIDRELLHGGADSLPEPLNVLVRDPVALDDAIESLLTYSLVEPADQSISIHRLVGAMVRDRLSDEDRLDWSSAAVRLVHDGFKFDSADVNTWTACGNLLPHALAATEHAEALEVAWVVVAELLDKAGRYLNRQGRFEEARGVLQRALNINRRVYGDQHPKVSAAANDLGRVLHRLGDFQAARQHFEVALAIDQQRYGASDPRVASVANNYAICLQAAGDLPTARQQFESAMAIYELHYGLDHPKVASVINNLGCNLHASGDLEGGRQQFQRALEIAENSFGREHPTVASVLYNLAGALASAGELAAAREAVERALRIQESTYGETHPILISGLIKLARLAEAQGDTDLSLRCTKRVATIRERNADETEPATLMVRDHEILSS